MCIWYFFDQIWKKIDFRNDANVFFTGTEIIPIPLLYGDSLPFDSFEMLKKWDASMWSDSLPDYQSILTDDERADFFRMSTKKTKFDRYVSKWWFSFNSFLKFSIFPIFILLIPNAMSEMEIFDRAIDYVFIFNQVTYFKTRLADEPSDIGSRARVMLTYLVTPRLFIHAPFVKVKMFSFQNW